MSCKSVASIKDEKIVASWRIPCHKKRPQNGALMLTEKSAKEKVEKGEKTLQQCEGNIKIRIKGR